MVILALSHEYLNPPSPRMRSSPLWLHPLLGFQKKFQACLEIKASSTSLKLNRVIILSSWSFEFDVLSGFLNP